jgi:hypothetical protein
VSEFEDVGRWLEGEWKVGRALQIIEEMGEMLADLNKSRTQRRVQELLAAAQADPQRAAAMEIVGGEAAVATIQAQVLSEHVLMVVATYLAKHENEPNPEPPHE